MRGFIALRMALLFACLGVWVPAASAHRAASPAELSAGAIPIPDVTHGEMAVLSRHAGAIRALAAQQTATDPVFRRLANFAELQRTYCLWSIVPGSIDDEESPFNECSHAYLAALKAVLLHLRSMQGKSRHVDALADEIEIAMIRNGAALVLCRYSRESFSTAAIVVPEWRAVLSHPPSLLALSGALAGIGIAGSLAAFGRPGGKTKKDGG